MILIPLVLLVGLAISNPLNEENNEVELVASGYFSFEKPTVVEFMSPTCMACVASRPTVSAMKEIYGDRVDFIEIDVRDTKNKDKVIKYKVRSTPTFIMFDSDGIESSRFSGIAKSRVMQPSIDDIVSN
ncbi:MAG: thioredoxin domain-containing protein [Chloroflexota bacterium]|nr:thioredoxin domain-containing protein [Chloroflexota bacterium]